MKQTFEWKKEFTFIVLIASALFLFFPELFLLTKGFLSGDHRVQHFPWASFLQENIRMGQLPWWCGLFHCGFPLLAEGQIGAFYPFNLLFYFFLPLFPAYNYGILLHYLLGALFFYFYLRSIKLSRFSSFMGALVFLFGTSQGGYYYNIISLKVLIWLPLTLIIADQIVEKKRYFLTPLLGLVFSMQFLGGYLQYAVYSISFSMFYFLWFAIANYFKEKSFKIFFTQMMLLSFAFVLSLFIASPQLAATLELATFSNRFSFTEAFVYIGSFNPFALSTLFFPNWDAFLRSEIYVGAIGLFFVLVSLFKPKTSKEIFFIFFAVLTFLLCLGKFNPLFVGLIKLTQFYSFRVPTKFLFFLGFALSILVAFGVEKWRQSDVGDPVIKKSATSFVFLTGLGVLGLLASYWILKIFSIPIQEFFRWFIESYFYNPEIHFKPLSNYIERFGGLYQAILTFISPKDVWNLGFVIFMVLSLAWVLFFGVRKKSKTGLVALVALLFGNLFFYGITSVKGNYEPLSFVKTDADIVSMLKEGNARLHRAPSSVVANDRLPLPASTNILEGVPVTGGYTPLIMKNYYDFLARIGDVNNSQDLAFATEEKLAKYVKLLQFLNVAYLASDITLNNSNFNPVSKNENFNLYQIQNPLPKAYFLNHYQYVSDENFYTLLDQGEFNPQKMIYVDGKGEGDNSGSLERVDAEEIENRNQYIKYQLQVSQAGVFVLSDLYYPGWHVFLNGAETTLVKANGLFKAVKIPTVGDYIVEFKYKPFWKKLIYLYCVGMAFAVFFPLGIFIRNSRKLRR